MGVLTIIVYIWYSNGKFIFEEEIFRNVFFKIFVLIMNLAKFLQFFLSFKAFSKALININKKDKKDVFEFFLKIFYLKFNITKKKR